MKKIKNNKGITLIALIITIIILLILAIVTINAITGQDDLIAKANNVKTKYNAEAENENTIMQSYLTRLDQMENQNTGDTDLDGILIITYEDQDEYTHLSYYANNEVTNEEFAVLGEYESVEDFEDYVISVSRLTTIPSGELLNNDEYSIYYLLQDYVYEYQTSKNGWSVRLIDDTKAEYGKIENNILGYDVVSMICTFEDCTTLITAPSIPNTVKYISKTFKGCTSLTGTITINANPTDYSNCFSGTTQSITLKGNNSTVLNALKDTSSNSNITVEVIQ